MTHYIRKFVPYNWTEAADACLISLKKKGLTFDLIRKMMGVSTIYQIKARYRNLGLSKEERPVYKPPRAWTEEEDEMLRALWARKLTAREISISIGKTRNAVIGRAHRLELEKRCVSRKPKKKIARLSRKKIVPKAFLKKYTKEFKKALKRLEKARMEGGVSFTELEPHHCRFISGDPMEDHIYCGREVKPQSRFCPEHHKLCFKPA